MVVKYVFINFFASIGLFYLVIAFLKSLFSINKYIFSDMDFMSLSKIISKRVGILFVLAIITLFLSMIPLRFFLNSDWFSHLPFEYRINLYLINSYMALNILFYSFYKIISYEKKKSQYTENVPLNDFDFDINKIMEKARYFGKLNGSRLFIKNTLARTSAKNIFMFVFVLLTSTLLVFFIMIIFDSYFWNNLDINNINGIPYIIYAFGMLVFMDLFFICGFFSKIYIDLENKTVVKSVFGFRIKSAEIKRTEVRVRALYHKGIYLGMFVYFYNNYYGEFPFAVIKDKDKVVELLEFLRLMTNKDHKVV